MVFYYFSKTDQMSSFQNMVRIPDHSYVGSFFDPPKTGLTQFLDDYCTAAWNNWFHKEASKISILEGQLDLRLLPILEPLFVLRQKRWSFENGPSQNQTLTKPKHFIVLCSNRCINLKPDKQVQFLITSNLNLKIISNPKHLFIFCPIIKFL